MSENTLRQAIRERRSVNFQYDKTVCAVNPHVLYHEERAQEVLLDGAQIVPTRKWRTFHVARIDNIELTTDVFLPHPIYEPPQPGDPNIIVAVKIG